MFIVDRIKNRKNHEVKFSDPAHDYAELKKIFDDTDTITMDLLEKNQERLKLLNKAQNN